MHFRNGRVAVNGDMVVQLGSTDGKVASVGVLKDATPGNDYCNGVLVATAPLTTTACLCDCIHVDDLAAILAKEGLDKRPAGK